MPWEDGSDFNLAQLVVLLYKEVWSYDSVIKVFDFNLAAELDKQLMDQQLKPCPVGPCDLIQRFSSIRWIPIEPRPVGFEKTPSIGYLK